MIVYFLFFFTGYITSGEKSHQGSHLSVESIIITRLTRLLEKKGPIKNNTCHTLAQIVNIQKTL